DEPYRRTPEDLGRIFVTTDDGRPVLLSTIADIKQSAGPVEIERKYQQRLVRIAANAVGRDLGSISEELEAKFGRLPLPAGFAVPRAGRIRLRPILMTVLTTVVGLLPMALAFGVGTEANQPLAIAVIGGLLVSTFFTLILIPTLYVMLEERFPRTIREAEETS